MPRCSPDQARSQRTRLRCRAQFRSWERRSCQRRRRSPSWAWPWVRTCFRRMPRSGPEPAACTLRHHSTRRLCTGLARTCRPRSSLPDSSRSCTQACTHPQGTLVDKSAQRYLPRSVALHFRPRCKALPRSVPVCILAAAHSCYRGTRPSGDSSRRHTADRPVPDCDTPTPRATRPRAARGRQSGDRSTDRTSVHCYSRASSIKRSNLGRSGLCG